MIARFMARSLSIKVLCAVLTAAAGLAASAQATAPPPAPIQALVDQALRYNPGLQAQRAKAQAALQVPSQAHALPDPTADVEFMNLSVNHPNLSEALTKSVSVGVSQTLPYPGKRALAKDKAEREAAVEAAKLKAMESELRGRVIGAAYRLVLAQRLLDLNLQTQDALRAAAKSAEGVYSSGMGTQADVLLAQTALTRSLSDRQDLLQQREITLQEMERMAGGPVDPGASPPSRFPSRTHCPAWRSSPGRSTPRRPASSPRRRRPRSKRLTCPSPGRTSSPTSWWAGATATTT